MEHIRSAVRPLVTLLGFFVFALLTFILALRFADANMTLVLVSTFTESVGILLGYWFGQRKSGSG